MSCLIRHRLLAVCWLLNALDWKIWNRYEEINNASLLPFTWTLVIKLWLSDTCSPDQFHLTLATKLRAFKLHRIIFPLSTLQTAHCSSSQSLRDIASKPSDFHSTDNATRFTKAGGNNRKSEIVVSVSGRHYSHSCTLIGFPFAGCLYSTYTLHSPASSNWYCHHHYCGIMLPISRESLSCFAKCHLPLLYWTCGIFLHEGRKGPLLELLSTTIFK